MGIIDDLRSKAHDAAQQLAQAEAEAAQHEAQAAAQRAAQQQERDARLLATWQAERERLQAVGKEEEVAMRKAVSAGDLNAALRAWVNSRSTRHAVRALQAEAQGAQVRTTGGQSTIPDLRYYQPDFLELVQQYAEDAAQDKGEEDAQEFITQV